MPRRAGCRFGSPQERAEQATHLAQLIGREPFHKRSWAELGYFLASSALACAAAFALSALAVAGSGAHRRVRRHRDSRRRPAGRPRRSAAGSGRSPGGLLGEEIPEPEPFSARPGFFGWLRASLGDRAAWRAVGYFVAKVPLTIFGVWFALSVWVEALFGIASPLTGATGTARFGAFGRLRLATTAGRHPGSPPTWASS